MLLQIRLNWDFLQVKKGEGHPDCDVFGYMTCPVCSRHLHGHGWRKRHLEEEGGRFILVWVHRKKCPGCGMTCTLIPEGMAAVSQYTLGRIREALYYRSSHGHCTKKLQIPVTTQKRWWRNFTVRVRAAFGMFPTPQETGCAIGGITPLSTLPLGWIETKDSGDLKVLLTRLRHPHHIMFLPASASP